LVNVLSAFYNERKSGKCYNWDEKQKGKKKKKFKLFFIIKKRGTLWIQIHE